MIQCTPLNEASESMGGSVEPGGAAIELLTESSGSGGDVG